MIKEYKWKILLTTIVTLLPMAAGLILWKRLPDSVPIHWNAAGEMDGEAGKAFAVFAIPGFMAVMHLFCVMLMCLDPKTKGQTKKVLGIVLWICPFMSVLAGAVIYAVALGARLNVASLVLAATGLLFVAVGNYLPKCKRNYTIGIKVMWALEDEANWNATHRFAGKVWVTGGLFIILASLLLPRSLLWLYLTLAVLMSSAPVAYSYLYYRKHGSTK